MKRILLSFLCIGMFQCIFAQQPYGEPIRMTKSDRLNLQNQARHFVVETYYSMLPDVIRSIDTHNDIINYLMAEEGVRYTPEFTNNDISNRYMTPVRYFMCLHRVFAEYDPEQMAFSVSNEKVDDVFLRYSIDGCCVGVEYDLEVKYQNNTLSKKRCRMYCLFPNRDCRTLVKSLQIEPITNLLTQNVTMEKKKSTKNESFEILLSRAKTGDCEAQLAVGKKHYFGSGTLQSYKKAFYWFQKAAEQDNAVAQCYLGVCFYYGRAVEQNYKEAVKWYRMAAGNGNVSAVYNLGNCYYYGRGVLQSYQEAVKLYRKAADFGDVRALEKLGLCYCYGYGVPQDDNEARKWLRLAASQGNEKASSLLQEMETHIIVR